MGETVVVTAAGGKTGRHVIPALVREGFSVRALALTGGVHELAGDGVETVAGDMLAPGVLTGLLDGAAAVIHIGPTFHPLEIAYGQAVIDAAARAGIERFVQFSVYHPQIEYLLNHQAKLAVENYVVGTELNYTILQPMHYMQNLDPAGIVANRAFRLPYALATPLALVDLADVAEVAARVLREPGHDHATYPLCGADFLTTNELLAIISRAAGGVEIDAAEISIPDFIDFFCGDGFVPHYTVDAIYRLMTYYGLRGIKGNANVLRWLLGREPSSFEDYVRRSLAAA